MLDQSKAEQIVERVKKFATTKDVEVIVNSVHFSLTRFANNTIHQNVAEDNNVVSVRTVIDGKTARATTNKTDDDSLKRAVEAAERLTKVQEPDPDLLPLSGKIQSTVKDAPSRYFEQSARLTPEDRASGVAKIVEIAKKNKLVTAGIFSSGETFEGILNSAGLIVFHRQSSAEVSVTMLNDAHRSSGWQKRNAPDIRMFDPAEVGEIAAKKAIASADPKELPPGKYDVILEPSAVLDLVGFMFQDFGAQSVLDERSFLNERIGTRLFGENITIDEDAYHPLQSGVPFDGEGVPKQRVRLVETGVIKNVVFARASAEKMKKSPLAKNFGEIRPTGHGFPLPNEIGDAPMNIVLAGAERSKAKTVEQMVAESERAILVTRLWYIREVEPYQKVLTGMTRDGTFLVEGGKVKHGTLNFRFNESLVEMLNNVLAMSESVRSAGEESFDMVVPAMKVRDFNFTEVTKF
jgi:predicted Zn-dependent protease